MHRSAQLVVGVGVLGLLMGGCPGGLIGGQENVEAKIAISSTSGDAPLTVTVSGSESRSVNGAIRSYAWDFGDGETASTENATHTFDKPGRYVVMLTVTDETGETGEAAVVVRAAGSDAVVAVIEANVTSGPAPLAVSFSGRKSSSEDDTIRDYFWDFDDLTTSRSAEPRHVFVLPGTYIVKLRVVTAGGVEASTQTMISVSGGSGSLQFAGDDVATLPIATTAALTGLTFEAWFLASGVGGSVFSLEPGGFSLAVLPGSNLIRITVNGNSTDISAVNLGGQWHYLAVTYGQPTGVTVYLDGFAAAPVAATGAVQTSLVSLGEGFNGRIAEVRLWSGARTAVQIAADAVMAPTGSEAGLLGAWNLNEGSGQSLRNLVGGAAGTLGTSDSAETSDPTWSTDGPRGP